MVQGWRCIPFAAIIASLFQGLNEDAKTTHTRFGSRRNSWSLRFLETSFFSLFFGQIDKFVQIGFCEGLGESVSL